MLFRDLAIPPLSPVRGSGPQIGRLTAALLHSGRGSPYARTQGSETLLDSGGCRGGRTRRDCTTAGMKNVL